MISRLYQRIENTNSAHLIEVRQMVLLSSQSQGITIDANNCREQQYPIRLYEPR